MKFLTTSFLVIAFFYIIPSCRTMMPIKSHYDNAPKPFNYTGDSLFVKVKQSLASQNAKIIDEDAISITAELHNTKWAWEKNGLADNENAFVIIQRYYDIGSNRLYKPLDVITAWKISISQEKNVYFIKLTDVVANYRSVHYVSQHNAGVTVGKFEKIISDGVK